MRFLLILISLITICNARYTSFREALVNGTKVVDIVLYGDYLSSNSAGYFSSNLYGDRKFIGNAGYFNAQIGLGYTTGFFYDFRFAISFRAAQSIFSTANGFPKDFSNNTDNLLGRSAIALGETFLEYFDGDTAIKLGRFQPLNEFVNHLIDGVWVRNGSFKNLILEGMWAYEYGRVKYYEMSPFKELDKFGWFNFGVKYYLSEDFKNSVNISAFTTFIPGVFVTFGARWHSATSIFGTDLWVGVDAGFAGSIEDDTHARSFKNNTFLVDARLNFGVEWFDVMAGYMGSGNSGMGSLGVLGVGSGALSDSSNSFYSNVQPFFIWGGKAIKMGRNAHLIYAAARFKFLDDALKLYFVYGATFFNGSSFYGGNASNISQNELNATVEYGIIRDLSLILHIADTHLGKGVPNSFEINGGFRFMF